MDIANLPHFNNNCHLTNKNIDPPPTHNALPSSNIVDSVYLRKKIPGVRNSIGDCWS